MVAKALGSNPFAASLGLCLIPPPRRMGVFHFYIKKYYAHKMKAEYERRWKLQKAAYDALNDDDESQEQMPQPVKIRTLLAQELWLKESDEFREQTKKEAEEEYGEAVSEWQILQQTPKTPQEYAL